MIQMRKLCLGGVVSAVEPEPTCRAAVNTERCANRATKLSWSNDVLLGKNLDAFPLAPALYRYPQFQRDLANVNSALLRRKRFLQKDPQMSASSAHFERRLDPAFAQLILELEQVFHCIPVVGVDSYPFAALILGVDRIEADRDCSLQVAPDSVIVQF
jgi:hypothetical protein